MDSAGIVVGILVLFVILAVLLVTACVEEHKSNRWTERDDRALDLESKRHQ